MSIPDTASSLLRSQRLTRDGLRSLSGLGAEHLVDGEVFSTILRLHCCDRVADELPLFAGLFAVSFQINDALLEGLPHRLVSGYGKLLDAVLDPAREVAFLSLEVGKGILWPLDSVPVDAFPLFPELPEALTVRHEVLKAVGHQRFGRRTVYRRIFHLASDCRPDVTKEEQ